MILLVYYLLIYHLMVWRNIWSIILPRVSWEKIRDLIWIHMIILLFCSFIKVGAIYTSVKSKSLIIFRGVVALGYGMLMRMMRLSSYVLICHLMLWRIVWSVNLTRVSCYKISYLMGIYFTSLLFCGFIKAVAFCSPIESKWSVVLLRDKALTFLVCLYWRCMRWI